MMTSNVIPFAPFSSERWFTTEPELHSIDQQADK
jgi:hypothetical protein